MKNTIIYDGRRGEEKKGENKVKRSDRLRVLISSLKDAATRKPSENSVRPLASFQRNTLGQKPQAVRTPKEHRLRLVVSNTNIDISKLRWRKVMSGKEVKCSQKCRHGVNRKDKH